MKDSLKKEFQNILLQSSQIHCALHFFNRELIYFEWGDWKTLISSLLGDSSELEEILRPLKTVALRKQVFRNLKFLQNIDQEDWRDGVFSFSQEATLVWLYFYNRRKEGVELGYVALELAEMMAYAHVAQMKSPGWLMEKIVLKMADFHRLKLKAHPALKHPDGPFVYESKKTLRQKQKVY